MEQRFPNKEVLKQISAELAGKKKGKEKFGQNSSLMNALYALHFSSSAKGNLSDALKL